MTVLVTEEILLDLADSQTPQGIVAIVQKEDEQLPDLRQGKYLFFRRCAGILEMLGP